jgi:DNA-binding transcriptional LysR family regulator
MLSLRQISAFRAIVETGNFSTAADRLGTTQPAISKRIAEMEATLGVSLFDRDNKRPQLTQQGHGALPLCIEILELCDRLTKSLNDVAAFAGVFRLGITELVALTFLPALVTGLRRRLPQMQLRVEVKMAEDLFEDLAQDRLDAAISPGAVPGHLFKSRVASTQMAWMCAGSRDDVPDSVSVSQLATYPLLAQTQRSGLQARTNEWLVRNGVKPNLLLSSNSLAALYGMTVAGLGLSLLPATYFAPRVREGLLKVVGTTPEIGPLEYFLVHAGTGLRPVVEIVAEEVVLAAEASPDWN